MTRTARLVTPKPTPASRPSPAAATVPSRRTRTRVASSMTAVAASSDQWNAAGA